MLTILVPMSEESFNESDSTFVVDVFPLQLEHSLAALSKWESIVEKPFLAPGEKTTEEVMEYIKAMIVTPDFPPEVLENLSKQNITDINTYIDSKQTATWFSETKPETKGQEIVTAEVLYYWMSSFQIPWEAQHWHLNRLLTLIKVFDLKQSKPKKMGRSDLAARNRELNARRKAELGTRG